MCWYCEKTNKLWKSTTIAGSLIGFALSCEPLSRPFIPDGPLAPARYRRERKQGMFQKAISKNFLSMVLASLFMVFGIQLAVASSEVRAAGFEDKAFEEKFDKGVFEDKFKDDDFDDDFKDDDFKDEKFDDEDFEDELKDEKFKDDDFRDLNDDELIALALQMRLHEANLKKLFANQGNMDRFFDPKIHKGLLRGEDLKEVLGLHKRLMDEAHNRLFFIDEEKDDDDHDDDDDDDKKDEEKK
jgi:hypothetical protein